MIKLSCKKVLVLAPHTDDAEVGCGGTLNKLVQNGCDVYYACFSFAEESIPVEFDIDSTKKEVLEAVKVLGIQQNNMYLFSYKVRNFPQFRQSILDDMVKLKNIIEPDLVFLPCSFDIHQDHKTIYEEGLRAFKKSTILGYQMIRNTILFSNNVYIVLNEQNINCKLMASNCYKSQLVKYSLGFNYLTDLAKIRGYEVGQDYAECFELIKLIVL